MFRRLWFVFIGIFALLMLAAIVGCEAAPEGSAEWYFARAYQFAKQGDYNSAITNYTDAIKVEPLLSKAYVNRAAAYDSIG